MPHYRSDTEFKPTGIAAPLAFMALFIVFVYGALIVGLMGVANTLIHRCELSFFLQRGNFGVFLGVCCLAAAWALLVAAFAALPYFILRRRGRNKTARLVKQVIIILMFHIFAMPFIILWPMIRNSSPALRAKHFAKLRRKYAEQHSGV